MEEGRGEDFCGFAGAVHGFGVGAATAVILDAALLAKEPVRDERRISACVTVGPHSSAVYVSGRF